MAFPAKDRQEIVRRCSALINLALRQQINCGQREKKIRHKHRRAGVIFCHSLPEEQGDDRYGRNDRTVERDGRSAPKNYHDAPNRAQRPGSNFTLSIPD